MKDLLKALNYNFKNEQLLQLALTHPSITKDIEDSDKDNQRLEFLGDAVLQLVISKRLYDKYPLYDEGELTAIRISHVCRDSLVNLAKYLNLGKYLIMDYSMDSMGGRNNAHNLEDCFEALMAAIYLDGGLENASRVINQIYDKLPSKHIHHKNSKGQLQEYLQSKKLSLPEYKLIEESGPDHEKSFTIKLFIDGLGDFIGKGKSIKAAEQEAASIALVNINKLLKEND